LGEKNRFWTCGVFLYHPLRRRGLWCSNNWEADTAADACGSRSLSWWCEDWRAVGLGWWVAGVGSDVVQGPVQNVRRIDSVCWHEVLPAAHNILECVVGAGDDFMQSVVLWIQGAAYGVLL